MIRAALTVEEALEGMKTLEPKIKIMRVSLSARV